MANAPRPAACDRARVWAGLLPDGELSTFERRLLDAHCAKCAQCRRLRDDVNSFTGVVRSASSAEMTRPVRIPRARFGARRPVTRVLTSGLAAALALAAAVWIGPQVHMQRVETQAASPPLIIFTPAPSSGDNQAMWTFKRSRGSQQISDRVSRRPGPILG
jgi:ferric-dicitrate binding protein FerR (iron transport regulator)